MGNVTRRYQATLVFYQHNAKVRMVLTRHGDQLVGRLPPALVALSTSHLQNVVLTYAPTRGHLTFRATNPTTGHLGPASEFRRLNTSTAMPTLSP